MYEKLSPFIGQFKHIISQEEAKDLLRLAEKFGFIDQQYEPPYIPEVRTRAMGTAKAWAAKLSERVIPHIAPLDHWLVDELQAYRPAQSLQWQPQAVNERFRFYRYAPLDRFAPHRDHPYIRNDREQTFLSMVLYLDEDCEGGETRFPDFSVRPQLGTALVYPHWLLHEGGIVFRGIKTVLRTDIFYFRAY
ncbi:MAG: 2OG-Fe(II) oxygenase [Rhodothermia bacterium]|nr:2OG-Fe(II) oxygenase [Rhodothermia bacterium]